MTGGIGWSRIEDLGGDAARHSTVVGSLQALRLPVSPRHGMRLNRFVLFVLLPIGAGLIWLALEAGTPDASLRTNRRGADQQIHGLIDKLKRGSLGAAEHTALLEQLLSLGQLDDAQMALEARKPKLPLPRINVGGTDAAEQRSGPCQPGTHPIGSTASRQPGGRSTAGSRGARQR